MSPRPDLRAPRVLQAFTEQLPPGQQVLVDRWVPAPLVEPGLTDCPGLPVHQDHKKLPALVNLVAGALACSVLHK
ncbi:MAG: hypothetical protein ABSF89_00950 [Acidimicrobiales bacterium]